MRECNIIEGGYLRDVLDQPAALRRTVDGLAADEALHRLARDLRAGAFPRVVLTGMGSSFHALHPLHIALSAYGLNSVMAETSELVHSLGGLLKPRSLLVAVSQSGRSVEMVRLLERAGRDVVVIGLTNHADSPLGARADARLLMRAGAESTVTCKTYLATLALLEWLGAVLGGGDLGPVRAELERGPAAVGEYLGTWRRHVDQLMDRMKGVEHLFVVGRGRSLATAGTAGLILKESAHFPAEGMSSAGFRHGPFEMLSSRVFVLVLAGDPASAPLNRRLADDIQRAGGQAALVGTQAGEDAFRLPSVPEALLPLVEILPVQMLSLALAARAGREAGKFSLATKVTSVE
jgi:glutamine---fructose-6-phosphate transaminase (isomerizing)